MLTKQKPLTIREFNARFADDDKCLDTIFQMRYGKQLCCPGCATVNAKFYRIKTRKSYECGQCKYQIYPLAGTIMEGTNTKLSLWFYAIYLFSTCKNGVSAKELERQLGVTYKCAWRMGHKIRELMVRHNSGMFSGVVEVDEMLLGGRVRGGRRGWGAENKICLVGIVERGGRVKTTPISDRERANIIPLIEQKVEKGTIVNTDEFKAYNVLTGLGYEHRTVIHSKFQWAQGPNHTNTIESRWSNLQKWISGTHTFVSRWHLQKYLGEFDFRHNHRKGYEIFDEILKMLVSSDARIPLENQWTFPILKDGND